MILKSFLFSFLIICYFQISSSQNNFSLLPKGTINEKLTGSDSYIVILGEDIENYEEFIRITLETNSKLNPMIIISKDDQTCTKNRIYSGTQSADSTYYFFKTDQIYNKAGRASFYICFIQTLQSTEYNIIIANEDKAYLPIDTQTSYFVSHYNTKMKFNFILDQDKIIDHINFWAKGQNITNVTFNPNTLETKKFEYGYVFYGDYSSREEYELEIEGQVGDFITIGSLSLFQGKTNKLKENSKEIIAIKPNNIEEICFPIKFNEKYPMHINGKIYTRKAFTFFKDEKGEIIDLTTNNITNGILSDLNAFSFLDLPYKTEGHFCLSDLESNTEPIIFSIQMTTNKDVSLIHPPMIHGEITRHFLLQGEMAAFYGLKPGETAKEVNLNLKALKGFPEMYFFECDDFPNCQYNNDSLKEKAKLFPSNRMTVYSFYIEEEDSKYRSYSPITNFQPIMLVYCAEGGKVEYLGESTFCEFDTSYFTNEDRINIYESSSFSQYLLKGEEDKYKINIENEENLDRVYLDLLVFSGDVDLRVHGRHGPRSNKYYLSSKIYYSVRTRQNDTKIEFEVFAQKNSFYMVQYQLVKRNDDSLFLNRIESGVNFISSIRMSRRHEEEKRLFDLINYKYEYNTPYLITFYSQNSNFYSYRIFSNGTGEAISLSENSAQMIIESDDSDYNSDVFKFGLETSNFLPNRNRSKDYMIYVAGLELSNSIEEWNQRSLSLTEGVPHRFIFTQKHPFIFYSYHMSDYSNTLALKFLLLDKASYEVNIRVGDNFLKKENVYRDGNIYIKPYEFLGKCEDLEVCTVVVSILLNDNNDNNEINKGLEFSMYQIDETPIYLEKNVLKKDIINGNRVKHYYFDIEDDEIGDIILDFERGSGNIYASVQRKEGNRTEENPDWRGRYKFPTTFSESIKYATYNKKIIIEQQNTRFCRRGCFVLITVESNLFADEGFEDDFTPYRISITPRVIALSTEDLAAYNPNIKIGLDEFIIGDINLLLPQEIKYDYYEITLPQDGEYVYIDWQADYPSFILNIGGELRPDLNNEESIHYKSSAIGDYVYQYPKDQILKKINSTADTLEGVKLIIGIYSNYMDSIYSSPYAFKIYMPPKELDVIQIRSDQKTQCLTFNKIEKNYICYFSVLFEEMDIGSNLVIYPKSQNGQDLTIYGNLFDSEAIEKNEISVVQNYFNEIIGKNSYKENKKYIYINNIPKNKAYLFVTVVPKIDVVEILSSTYYYYENMILYPNPSSPQIFAISNSKINLNFKTSQDLLLNIVSISGEGYFQWESKTNNENKKFYLNGFEDRYSLTTFTDNEDEKLTSLQVCPNEVNPNSNFIFYISYYPRNSNYTVDQLKSGRSSEFNYRKLNMPLNFYSPISKSNSWFVNINFYDLSIKNSNKISYDNQLFNIVGTFISQDDANKARFEPKFKPKIDDNNSIKGFFDLSFGMLSLNGEIMKNLSIENPNVFFTIDIDENNKFDFDDLGLELSLYSDMALLGLSDSVPENVYLNGKISDDNTRFVYLLKYYSDSTLLNLEYSANTDAIKWILTTDYLASENDPNFQVVKNETVNGRQILTIKLPNNFYESNPKLYLIIQATTNLNTKLGHYIFKYTNAKDEKELIYYNQPNNNITFKKETKDGKTNYKVDFYPIENNNVSYYIKAVYNKGKVKDEKMDTIAISEATGRVMQINNPDYEKGKVISFTLENVKERVSYIKVMAKINNKAEKEFLLYNPVIVSDSGDDNGDDTTYVIVIVFCSIFAVVVVILIVVVLYNRKKNKNFLTQVNKISFVDNNDKSNNENLLLTDEISAIN